MTGRTGHTTHVCEQPDRDMPYFEETIEHVNISVLGADYCAGFDTFLTDGAEQHGGGRNQWCTTALLDERPVLDEMLKAADDERWQVSPIQYGFRVKSVFGFPKRDAPRTVHMAHSARNTERQDREGVVHNVQGRPSHRCDRVHRCDNGGDLNAVNRDCHANMLRESVFVHR